MFIVFSGVLELLLLLFDFSICFFGDVIGGKRLLEFFFLICFCFFVCFVLFGILVFIVFQLNVDVVYIKYICVVLYGLLGIKMVL